MMPHLTQHIERQHGAALIVALSILLVLTLIGVSAMSTSALQERMAGNARDADVAFEAAEAGLRAGEQYLAGMTTAQLTSDFGTSGKNASSVFTGKFTAPTAATDPEVWVAQSNWDCSTANNTTTYTGAVTVAKNPCYLIQRMDATLGASPTTSPEAGGYNTQTPAVQGSVKVFQVTAIGTGLSTSSRVMLQSYYGRDGI